MINEPELSFEQGPIRPPNEARSLLLRITRNCPWNQCLFCPVYKGEKFSLRKVEEVKKDIQTARDIADDIKALSWRMGMSGMITNPIISHIISNNTYSYSYKSVALWLYYGTGACFLQDADNFVMKTKDFVDILRFLREKFPDLRRVTTYSRSRTVSRKSLEEMKKIKEAGLDRVHIGLESGHDPLLKFIKKGVTAAQHIDAGKKVIEAGMSLSEYIMPGLIIYATDVELNHIFNPPSPSKEHEALAQQYLTFISHADLLIADGQYTDEEYEGKVGWGHSSIELLLDVVSTAQVKQLAIFHHDPQHSDTFLDELWMRHRSKYHSTDKNMDIFWAREGLTLAV